MKRYLMILSAVALSLCGFAAPAPLLVSSAVAQTTASVSDAEYKQYAALLTRESDILGGYDWSTSGARGATTVPYLYSGTYYRLVRGLTPAGRTKFRADLKREKSLAANLSSGQWPVTEKKLILSFTKPDATDKTLYAVANFYPN